MVNLIKNFANNLSINIYKRTNSRSKTECECVPRGCYNYESNLFVKNLLRFSFVWIILLIFWIGDVFATHIVGGNLTYKRIQGNTFEITFTMRRDCEFGSPEAQFDDPASIAIFSSTGALMIGLGTTNGQLLLPFNDDDTLNQIIESDCGFEGKQVCVHETIYRGRLNLPFRPGGYILVYQRCCRNKTLNNVVDPLEAGATYFVHITEEAWNTNNSSPTFKNWPAVYICANEDLVFDHSATDIDGDSLVYRLYNPFTGASLARPKPQPASRPPYDQVIFQPPYSVDDFLGGVPLRIDPVTGLLTGRPNLVGQFLVGIAVDEYKNGVYVGTVYRDFQYNVRICSAPPKADFTTVGYNCEGLEVQFENKSESVTRLIWNFNYPSEDSAFITEELNPTFTFPQEGVYNVQLIAIRQSDNCRDEIVKKISVFDTEVIAAFKASLDGCLEDGKIRVKLEDRSKIATPDSNFVAWEWTVVQNDIIQSFSGNPITVILDPDDFEVYLTATAENGCFGSSFTKVLADEVSFTPDFQLLLNDCEDDNSISITLKDATQELYPTFNFINRKWTVLIDGIATEYQGESIDLKLTRKDFKITLEISADNGCSGSVSKDFNINDFIPKADFVVSLDGCDESGLVRVLLTPFTADTSQFATVQGYLWNINGVEYNLDTLDLFVNQSDTLVVNLIVILGNNCRTIASRVVAVSDLLPNIDFAFEQIACPDRDSVTLEFYYLTNSLSDLQASVKNWLFESGGKVFVVSGDTVFVTIGKGDELSVSVNARLANNCVISNFRRFLPGPYSNISFDSDILVVCQGEEKVLIAGLNPALSYTWSPLEGLDLTDPLNPVVKLQSSTKYYVTVSDGVCEVSDSIEIVVLNDIDINISGNPFTCNGDVLLEASGGIGAGTYEWSNSVFFSNIIATGNELSTQMDAIRDTFYVRFNTEECEGQPQPFIVSRESLMIEVATPFEVCSGDTVNLVLINLIPDHDINVVWDSDPKIISGGNTLSPTVSVGSGMEPFTLYFTATNQFGCELRDSVEIIFGQRPAADIDIIRDDCNDYKVCFRVNGNYFGFVRWNFGDPSNPSAGSLLEEPCYTYPGPGTYTVKLENLANACAFSEVERTFNLFDVNQLIFEVDNDTVCEGFSLELSVPQHLLGTSFSWLDEFGNILSQEPRVTLTGDRNKFVILRVVDELNCEFSDTFYLNTFVFDVTLDKPEVFCFKQTAEVGVQVSPLGEYSYFWSPEDCILRGQGTDRVEIDVTKEKELNVLINHNLLGCETSQSFTIQPFEFEFDVDAAPSVNINLGDSVLIFVVAGQSDWQYSWSNGSNQSQQFVSPKKDSTFFVTVTDEYGCVSVAEITIFVRQPNCEEDVFLPNAFSPNNDGVNDVLYVRSLFIDEMHLIIYNRWGEEVFSTRDINQGWDGTYKGQTLSPDAFAYWLTARCKDNVSITKRGNISLLR